MELLNSIGTRLKAERERLGLTQSDFAQVAEDAGVPGATRQSQARYEKGLAAPSCPYLAALATAGVDVLYVLTGHRGMQAAPPPLKDGEATLLESYRALDKRGQAAVLAVIATMSEPEPSSKGRTKAPSREQAIGVHVTQHAHGNDTTQVGSVKNLRIVRKSK